MEIFFPSPPLEGVYYETKVNEDLYSQLEKNLEWNFQKKKKKCIQARKWPGAYERKQYGMWLEPQQVENLMDLALWCI